MKLFSRIFPKTQLSSSSPNILLENPENSLQHNIQKDCQTVLSNIIDEELELIYLALRIFHKKYRFTAGEANNMSANDLVLLPLRRVMDGFYTTMFDAERTEKATARLLKEYHKSPPLGSRAYLYKEAQERRKQAANTILHSKEKIGALRAEEAELAQRIDYEFPDSIIDTVLNTIYKLAKSKGDLDLKPVGDDLNVKYKEYNEYTNIIAPIIEEFKHLSGKGVKEEAIKTFHATSLGKIGEWTNKIVNEVHDAREEGGRGLHLEDPQYFLKNTGEDCRVAIVLTEMLDDIKKKRDEKREREKRRKVPKAPDRLGWPEKRNLHTYKDWVFNQLLVMFSDNNYNEQTLIDLEHESRALREERVGNSYDSAVGGGGELSDDLDDAVDSDEQKAARKNTRIKTINKMFNDLMAMTEASNRTHENLKPEFDEIMKWLENGNKRQVMERLLGDLVLHMNMNPADVFSKALEYINPNSKIKKSKQSLTDEDMEDIIKYAYTKSIIAQSISWVATTTRTDNMKELVEPDYMKDDDECVTDDSVYDIQFALFKLNGCRLYDKRNIKSRLYKKSCEFYSKSCGHKLITSTIVTLEKNVTYTLIPYTFDGDELGNFKIDIYLNTEHDNPQNITLQEASKESNTLTACKMKYYLRYGGKKRTLKKKDKHKKTKNKRNRNKRSKRKKVN